MERCYLRQVLLSYASIRDKFAYRIRQKRILNKVQTVALDMKIRRLRKTKKVYQPSFVPSLDWNLPMTNEQKFSLTLQTSHITSRIAESESTLDLGCNLGFISLNIARQLPNNFVLGIEPDHDLVEAANRSSQIAAMNNVVFNAMAVTPLNVGSLPIFDNVILLSVYQQWVRSFGIQDSRFMLRKVLDKTEKRMFFSMATTNGSPKIRSFFPDMGKTLEDSDDWICNNILNFADVNIEVIDRIETTYGSSLPRTLFLVSKV